MNTTWIECSECAEAFEVSDAIAAAMREWRAEMRVSLEMKRGEIMGRMIQESDSNALQGGKTSGFFTLDEEFVDKMNEEMVPLEEETRLKYRDLTTQLDIGGYPD